MADYWNRSGTEKQYQFSYNNMYGRLSWSVSAQRVYTPDSSGHRRDDRVSLNFSYPLWFGENRTANLTSNTAFNNSRFASSQIGVNGSLDSENNLNYGVSTTTATGGQHDVALNGSYRTPWTTLNGSYSGRRLSPERRGRQRDANRASARRRILAGNRHYYGADRSERCRGRDVARFAGYPHRQQRLRHSAVSAALPDKFR